MKWAQMNESTNFEYKDFKELLKTVTENYKLTQASLSKVLGIDENLISDFDRGRVDISSIPLSVKVPLDELVTMLSIGMQVVDNDDRV